MPVDLNQAKSLFLAMLELPVTERAAFLETHCGADAGLRQRVEAMLQADEASGELLPRPAAEMLTGNAATAAFDSQAGLSGTTNVTQHDAEVLACLGPSSRPDSLGRLGHYEIQEVVGQGGFGTVFKAFDEKLHRVVAIKVLSPAFAANGAARKRFIREARTAAAVKNEHVVGIYDVEDQAQPPYLAMEMIDGISLQDKLDKHGPLGLKEILRIGLQMAEGLAAAHRQGLVHRDIKPANILLENGVERVKITDFGLARAVDDASVTQSGTVAGTPLYMSPEQAEGLAVDHRSDLFSLGTVLYAMCTGHSPFRASGTHAVLKRVIDASPRPIREINNDIPDWLCDTISKLHAKKPEERFQTAKEVAELLGQHLAHIQAPDQAALPRRLPARALLRPRRGPKVFIAASLMLLVLGAGWLAWHYFLPSAAGTLRVACPEPNLNIWLQGKLDNGSEFPRKEIAAGKRLSLPPGNYTLTSGMESCTSIHIIQFRINDGEERTVELPPWGYVEVEIDLPEARRYEVRGEDSEVLNLGSWEAGVIPYLDGCWFAAQKLHVAVFDEQDHLIGKAEVSVDVHGTARVKAARLESGWVQLFNGKDLTGWKTHAAAPGTWTVENQILKGSTSKSFLFSERGDYENFHLRVVAKINAGGDSNITFRAPFDVKKVGPKLEFYGVPDCYLSYLHKCVRLRDRPTPSIARAGPRDGGYPSALFTVQDDSLIRPDEWFTLELIADGNRFIAKIDGKEAANCTDPLSAFAKGHIALGLFSDQTVVQFRKIEIKELPPPSTPPLAVAPFVILSKDAKAEQKFATLIDAVDKAHAGDTIEIRGDGPFVCEPIKIMKALGIQAGAGFEPRLQFDPDQREGICSKAFLSLEGLRLEYVGGTKPGYPSLVSSLAGSLRLSDCNLLTNGNQFLVYSDRDTVEIVQSQLHSARGICVVKNTGANGSVSIDNCLLTGSRSLLLTDLSGEMQEVTCEVRRSTLLARTAAVHLRLHKPLALEKRLPLNPLLRVKSSHNVFSLDNVMLQMELQEDLAPLEDRSKALLRRILHWSEIQNLHGQAKPTGYLKVILNGKQQGVVDLVRDPENWKDFWGMAQPLMIIGQPSFRGGDLRLRLDKENAHLPPADFRLADGSPGKGAGPDGKDLGADVDLVGPGAAYEKWKQTPEYKEWQKKTAEAIEGK